MAGDDFGDGVDNRFSVRRRRAKFAYDNNFSLYVLQFDVTEKDMAIKDAYIAFTELLLKSFTLTTGVFNRPFGYEIAYSSSSRESPERARFTQALFNGERDGGVKLTFQPPKTSAYNFIKIDAGLFNGVSPTAVDFDKYKDFIGQINLTKVLFNGKLKASVGAFYYTGSWRAETDNTYKMGTVTDTVSGAAVSCFVQDKSYKKGDKLKREYMGMDAQLDIDNPFGINSIRGEFVTGTQPVTSGSSSSFAALPTDAATTTYTNTLVYDKVKKDSIVGITTKATTTTANSDAYIRKFSGGYIYVCQNVMATKLQVVFKYDWYDANTDVKDDNIALKAKTKAAYKATSTTDIAYKTIGLGAIYRLNSNLKLTFYYDMVTNEPTNIIKDTVR